MLLFRCRLGPVLHQDIYTARCTQAHIIFQPWHVRLKGAELCYSTFHPKFFSDCCPFFFYLTMCSLRTYMYVLPHCQSVFKLNYPFTHRCLVMMKDMYVLSPRCLSVFKLNYPFTHRCLVWWRICIVTSLSVRIEVKLYIHSEMLGHDEGSGSISLEHWKEMVYILNNVDLLEEPVEPIPAIVQVPHLVICLFKFNSISC